MMDGGETNIPKPAKPAYMETPYESPARINGSGTGPDSPFYLKSEAELLTQKQTPPPKLPTFAFEEEAPKTGNDAIIDAVRKVHSVVTKRIAYHEHEARRLRECLAPFVGMSRQVAQDTELPEGVQRLLALADQLDRGEPQS